MIFMSILGNTFIPPPELDCGARGLEPGENPDVEFRRGNASGSSRSNIGKERSGVDMPRGEGIPVPPHPLRSPVFRPFGYPLRGSPSRRLPTTDTR
mgnify:CR=1 FL=1